MSPGYRFYLLEREHIAAIRVCDCSTDADALLEADAELQTSKYLAIEVWDGPRRIVRLTKSNDSHRFWILTLVLTIGASTAVAVVVMAGVLF